MIANIEVRHEFLVRVAPIRVEGEKTAICYPGVGRRALQLSSYTLPGLAVPFDECLDAGYEMYDALGIQVLGTRKFGSEVHG